jgi:hypothetical protein
MPREKIFKILDEHFVKEMMMESSSLFVDNERHYSDTHLYVIFVWGEIDSLRILIRNWKTNKSFSKSVKIPFEISKATMVSFIKEVVYSNSGVESRDLLNDWYEIKKVEIRDKKISDLGI